MEIELFVRLIVPDNIAITAKNTLLKLGFSISGLRRSDYYRLECDDDVVEDYIKDALSKVDILANANKHRVSFIKDNEGINILVTDIGDACTGILNTLRERLGFKGIKAMEKGTVWTFIGCNQEDAVKMTKELLANENYQEFKVI